MSLTAKHVPGDGDPGLNGITVTLLGARDRALTSGALPGPGAQLTLLLLPDTQPWTNHLFGFYTAESLRTHLKVISQDCIFMLFKGPFLQAHRV